MKRMKILLIPPEAAGGTGSHTYFGMVREELERRDDCAVRLYPSSGEGPDIVHSLDLKHLDPLIATSLRSPLVVDVHDAYWLPGEWKFPSPDLPLRAYLSVKRRKQYAKILDRADGIVVHSGYVADKLGHRKARVVPYAVGDVRHGPPVEERSAQVVFAGRDYFRKGLLVLLKAWRIVHSVRPDAKLRICGREYPHGRLLAGAADLFPSIEWRRDMERGALLDEIRRAKALVLPSWTEAFGMVLIEAAAAGTPAVGTRVGGIPEALKGGEIGLLVERGDAQGLARAIVRCLEPKPDDGLIEMIKRAREAAIAYSAADMAQRLYEYYEEVLSGG